MALPIRLKLKSINWAPSTGEREREKQPHCLEWQWWMFIFYFRYNQIYSAVKQWFNKDESKRMTKNRWGSLCSHAKFRNMFFFGRIIFYINVYIVCSWCGMKQTIEQKKTFKIRIICGYQIVTTASKSSTIRA